MSARRWEDACATVAAVAIDEMLKDVERGEM